MNTLLDLSKLNTVQQEAVVQTEGPCLIIAGPGSGKTRVLTHRVAYLTEDKGISPYRIMVLTFTKKAANDMKERLEPMIGQEKVKRIWLGTFHHVFCKILRREAELLGFTKDFSIYDTEDTKRTISRIRKELSLPEEDYKTTAIMRRISQAKRKLMSPKAYQESSTWFAEDIAAKMPHLHTIYAQYQARCRASNAMDFDDILCYTYELFQNHPERLAHYQERFHYLFVDEFQDTDTLQYYILKNLAKPQNNLCVIGDDAQSIYAFRGADIKHILNFQQNFADSAIFRLEENYRSTKYIVKAANSLIKHNKQHTKALFTNNQQGDPIDLCPMFNDLEEADFIAKDLLQKHSERRLSYDQVAILYRTNNQSRLLEEAFVRQQVPYKVIGSLSFYQRQEVKDLLAYLHLIVNPNNEEALLRAINQPKRNIGPATIKKAREYGEATQCTLWESLQAAKKWMTGQTARNIASFTTLINESRATLENKSAFEIARFIAKQSGLLQLWHKSTDEADQNRHENLEELLEAIRLFSEKNTENHSLAGFLEEIVLLTSGDENEEKSKPAVKLMTAHKAKGLEFAHVYIIGVEKEIFPSAFASYNPSAVEEERRLFFVAMTRAQKSLTLTYTENRYRYGKIVSCEPSPFLQELDPACLTHHSRPVRSERRSMATQTPKKSFATSPQRQGYQQQRTGKRPQSQGGKLRIGMSMKHPALGEGTIEAIEPAGNYMRVVVKFYNGEKKTLMLKKSQL